MKHRLGIALLAVPLLALQARADDPFAPCLPWRIETGANVYFRVLSRENGWGAQLGPWYSYWPMEAHFSAPAIPSYPFWPAPQGVVPGGTKTAIPAPYYPPATGKAAPAAPSVPAASTFKPVGFLTPGPLPNGYYAYQQYPVWAYGH